MQVSQFQKLKALSQENLYDKEKHRNLYHDGLDQFKCELTEIVIKAFDQLKKINSVKIELPLESKEFTYIYGGDKHFCKIQPKIELNRQDQFLRFKVGIATVIQILFEIGYILKKAIKGTFNAKERNDMNILLWDEPFKKSNFQLGLGNVTFNYTPKVLNFNVNPEHLSKNPFGIRYKPLECSICLQTTHTNTKTLCCHEFCVNCLYEHSKLHDTCPLCREQMKQVSFVIKKLNKDELEHL